MNHNRKTGKRVSTILKGAAAAAVLILVVYIMVNGLGLVEGLDFGAGAY